MRERRLPTGLDRKRARLFDTGQLGFGWRFFPAIADRTVIEGYKPNLLYPSTDLEVILGIRYMPADLQKRELWSPDARLTLCLLVITE